MLPILALYAERTRAFDYGLNADASTDETRLLLPQTGRSRLRRQGARQGDCHYCIDRKAYNLVSYILIVPPSIKNRNLFSISILFATQQDMLTAQGYAISDKLPLWQEAANKYRRSGDDWH
ncbi:hypothetical protein JCM10296v2_000362 [Rhodotorula toruloides]